MRKLILFFIALIGIAAITSCKKDEVKVVLGTNFLSPAITAGLTNGSSVVLNKANKDVVLNIAWSNAYYGFKGSITYTLQMDKKGNNFASAMSLGSPSSTVLAGSYSLTMTTNDFNNKLLTLQADPENPVATALEFRVKATINDSVPTLYSPVVSATYTPYFIPIVYPKLYIPGNYEVASGYGTSDWSQSNAPYLASLKSNSFYEGYAYFAGTGNLFKFSSQLDWNGTNYGDAGVAGKLSTAGSADNLKLPVGGYYYITTNVTDLNYTATLTKWSIIGSVTSPGYNWSNDLDMTYNPTTKVWTATANLKAGEFKFRNNHDWAFTYGLGVASGKLDTPGANIPLAADGNYTITLDFSAPPIYRYKIVKN
jgi:starch-binding outer membrane protein SusE/F